MSLWVLCSVPMITRSFVLGDGNRHSSWPSVSNRGCLTESSKIILCQPWTVFSHTYTNHFANYERWMIYRSLESSLFAFSSPVFFSAHISTWFFLACQLFNVGSVSALPQVPLTAVNLDTLSRPLPRATTQLTFFVSLLSEIVIFSCLILLKMVISCMYVYI